ncbi:hypothetical protein DID77_02505 [Candidatus Marinamargulisbacteria bacterium SCGC AG-439-L15]|nr:hypothetical protein DID77_02505 [Candidatus Marinamargulisbacteria bacterium SCGC AG-439-L15]
MSEKKISFFYRPSTKKKLWYLLTLFCVVSVAFEIPLHRHSHFAKSGVEAMDGLFGFYAFLGIFGVLFLIVLTKILLGFFSVKETYYDA